MRRALEIDAKKPRRKRIFSGGLDWSGTYFADERVLDTDEDGIVSVDEYHSANTLVGHMDVATQTMGWAYSVDTLTTPDQYDITPRYPEAHYFMEEAGFNSESDIFWGYYNINYDYYKDYGYATWKGVGYANLTSYVYRAELLGDDMAQSAGYSCFSNPETPDDRPPLYDWLESATQGGWTDESVQWALANGNTAKFKAPLITVVGNADGLLALNTHSVAYKNAVDKYGRKRLYRQYLIEHGPHVDAHADGFADFDFDGVWGNEGAGDELTPMQPYAERAFQYLIDWAERGIKPPENKTVSTDPANDITDADLLDW